MQSHYEIPDTFWSLFRSVNREIYIESLLCINQEYKYSNYFLTREVCLQILSDRNTQKRIRLEREESETELDLLETTSSRILNWLVKTGWLKKIEDYTSLTTNIVIPDYAAIFIEAFEKLSSQELEETDIYIQNVYATLYSFQNNPKVNLNMLRTALVNTKKLNKALQDMLHNMDKFFERLLDKKTYGELLREHLDGYVEEVVRKKYHILKTSDNFYIYKMDIKKCLREMRENDEWIESVRARAKAAGDEKEDVLEILDQIERGFDDIEHRIANMDKEHTKYVRATVTRLNYLLSGETDTKGLVVQLLNRISAEENGVKKEEKLRKTAERMNLSYLEILSEKSLYKRRKSRTDFISKMETEDETEDLNREEVLKMNRIQMRYSRAEIEEFIQAHMTGDIMDAGAMKDMTDEDFEKLILAYDYSTRRNSKYAALNEEDRMVENGRDRYPDLKFTEEALMIEYYDLLNEEEQDDMRDLIQLLLRQTFLLERKYDRRAGRMVPVREYRFADRHLDFLKEYFRIAGITLRQNVHMGLIYIQEEALWGEKLSRLATIYILILKILYDEQMASVSSSNHVVVTLGMINGKAGDFHILTGMPSPTEMRKTIALLKKYQILEPLDVMEELDENSRMVIYPCINTVLVGDDVRELLGTFSEEEYSGDETAVQGTIEDMPE